MAAVIKTDVLIVGAGPTGLALACQLSRYGVDFVLLEKRDGLTPYSKAVGVHARTLEIYEQMDLAGRAVEQGAIAGSVRLLDGGEVRGAFDLSDLGHGLSAYPFMLLLEQSKNERLLYDYLRSRQHEVLWETELEDFSQGETGVRARARDAKGAEYDIEARYLVGCDGPQSAVRHTLGLAFEGSTFERVFYVADVQIDWKLSHDATYLFLTKESPLVFFPLKGENRYRIVGAFPEGYVAATDQNDALYDEVENRIKAEVKMELDIHDVAWFSTYKVHTRHAEKFSRGRCFLAGDAAHIHTPAGGQGMNTGIQDGYNLAWKLALVLKNAAPETLLETYSEERLENAKNLLQTTDRIFQFGASTDGLLPFLRAHVFPFVAPYLLRSNPVKKYVFPILSQIGIRYRADLLSQHDGDNAFHVKAGDRMPYFLVDGASVYDKLRQPKFHLLAFANAPGAFDDLQASVESRYDAEWVDFHALSLPAELAKIFGVDQPFVVALRPDNYIGFLSTDLSMGRTDDYLNRFGLA